MYVCMYVCTHTPVTNPQAPTSTSFTIPQISNQYISRWTNHGAEFSSLQKKKSDSIKAVSQSTKAPPPHSTQNPLRCFKLITS